MANFCPNCGQSVDSSASFCPSCGAALNGNSTAYSNNTYTQNTTANAASAVTGVLGTLVAVSLVGGLTRQLYYYGGRYFLDPYCRQPFMSPHLIMGPHRILRPVRPIMGPRPPMGGFRGPMGGPRGGGPRGGRR